MSFILVIFFVGFVLLYLQFCVYVLQIVVCPFVLFRLTIVLSVLFRFTDYDYLFGIFKLFLQGIHKNINEHLLSSFKVKSPSILIFMKTHLEHKFQSVRQFIRHQVTFYYACPKSVLVREKWLSTRSYQNFYLFCQKQKQERSFGELL